MDDAARRKLYEEHEDAALCIVRRLADKYLLSCVEDMQQEARMALWIATGTFDPTRGVKPLTYFTHCVRGHLMHYIRDQLSLIRVPHRRYAAGERCVVISEAELVEELQARDVADVIPDADAMELDRNLRGLPLERQRRVLLRLVRGDAPSKIAADEGIHKNSVSRYRRKAIARIRAKIEARNGI